MTAASMNIFKEFHYIDSAVFIVVRFITVRLIVVQLTSFQL